MLSQDPYIVASDRVDEHGDLPVSAWGDDYHERGLALADACDRATPTTAGGLARLLCDVAASVSVENVEFAHPVAEKLRRDAAHIAEGVVTTETVEDLEAWRVLLGGLQAKTRTEPAGWSRAACHNIAVAEADIVRAIRAAQAMVDSPSAMAA